VPHWFTPAGLLTDKMAILGFQGASLVPVDIVDRAGTVLPEDTISFLYSATEVVTSASPVKGPESGNTLIRIRGAGFLNHALLSCMFGLTVVKARWLSAEAIECLSPPKSPGTDLAIKVANNGVDFSPTFAVFSYQAGAKISGISPCTGPNTGGTQVVVSGLDFTKSSSLFCRFGAVDSAALFISSTRLSCVTPLHPSGAVSVEVSNNHKDWTTSGQQLTFMEPVLLTSVSPSSGPDTGGSNVQVTGANFYPPSSDIRCKFGETVTAEATFVTSSLLNCKAPAYSGARMVSVQLTMNLADYSTSSDLFFYHPPVTIDAIQPSVGFDFSSTVVTVVGSNFQNGQDLTCLFVDHDGVSFTDNGAWMSSSRVSCVTPGLRAGQFHVDVSVFDKRSSATSAVFEVFTPPRVSSLTPSLGSVEGGTLLRLEGAGFVDTKRLACRIGQTVVDASFVSSQHIHCLVPAGAEGAAPVHVSFNKQEFSNTDLQFLYIHQPAVFTVRPYFGPRGGGTLLNVTGTNFIALDGRAPATKCRFGDAVVPATLLSSSLMQCSTPPRADGSVDVEVCRPPAPARVPLAPLTAARTNPRRPLNSRSR